jgi:predicted  nucleic acid-binding Zn-ribbon protein
LTKQAKADCDAAKDAADSLRKELADAMTAKQTQKERSGMDPKNTQELEGRALAAETSAAAAVARADALAERLKAAEQARTHAAASLEAQAAEQQHMVSELQAQVLSLQSQLEAAKQDAGEVQVSLKQQVDAVKRDASQSSEQLAVAQAELAASLRELDAAQAQLTQTREELAGARAAAMAVGSPPPPPTEHGEHASRSAGAELLEELSVLGGELTAARAQVLELQAALDLARRDKEAMEREAAAAAAQVCVVRCAALRAGVQRW